MSYNGHLPFVCYAIFVRSLLKDLYPAMAEDSSNHHFCQYVSDCLILAKKLDK